ncbi:ATP/GTP-binding protein [Amycolatopsis halotolerans]|uniref:ATP/GTP-binding protein n=1 Tax=Amycolatopsis halotolerans TaxID=330083 RepID=A0ABV7QHM3_9PSEU
MTAVYGANASGKSSLLDGLSFMQQAVIQSFATWDAEGGVPRKPFRLRADASAEPTLFSAEIVVEGIPYAYGFSVNDDEIQEEWLYSFPEKRRRVLFERDRSEIKFGTTLARDLKSRLELLEEITRSNSLFLSACAQVRIAEWIPVYQWFRSQLRMRMTLGSLASKRKLAEQVLRLRTRNPTMLDKFLSLLAAADVGITGLTISEPDDLLLAEQVSQARAEKEHLIVQLNKRNSNASRKRLQLALQHAEIQLGAAIHRASESSQDLKFLHGTESTELELDEESAGTRSWLTLLPIVLDALEEGCVVAVDEIDTSLHPLLTAELIKLFRNPDTNQHDAQLIFTTHDSSLLGRTTGEEILPRDSIWFVEKDTSGASALFPLTDFKPRDGQNTERRYLGGSYGAVPVLDSASFTDAVRNR